MLIIEAGAVTERPIRNRVVHRYCVCFFHIVSLSHQRSRGEIEKEMSKVQIEKGMTDATYPCIPVLYSGNDRNDAPQSLPHLFCTNLVISGETASRNGVYIIICYICFIN